MLIARRLPVLRNVTPLLRLRIPSRATMASMTSDIKEEVVMDAIELQDGEK